MSVENFVYYLIGHSYALCSFSLYESYHAYRAMCNGYRGSAIIGSCHLDLNPQIFLRSQGWV
jgi:hypothetical protein